MTNDVGACYDAVAELYAELFLSDLEGNPFAKDWLATFAAAVTNRDGVIADLGCGPGHVTNVLTELGLNAVGYDLSPGQIEQANKAFPELAFGVADISALDHGDASFAGIVSRYSIIHMPPADLGTVFEEWMRVLEPGAPMLVSFFGALTVDAHGEPFGHTVATAYALYPATIASELATAGFVDIEIDTRPPPKDGRPFDQGTVLAHKKAH